MTKGNRIAIIGIACVLVAAGIYFIVHQHRPVPARVFRSENRGFNFENESGFWAAQTYPGSEACKSVSVSDEQAQEGRHSLKMMFHLVGGDAHDSCGEAWASIGTQNLTGQTVTGWIYAPQNSAGDPEHPNGYQLFVKDSQWHSEYGSLTGIVEGQWVKLSLTVGKTKPDNGWVDEQFNPTQTMVVGVKVAAGNGSTSTYDGPIYLDAVRW